MRKTAKKLLSIVAATTLLGSTVAFTACSDKEYQGDPVTGYDPAATVAEGTNGGFTVEKGDYVYFINGQESYTASNAYGDVVKGSLMRISKEDLKNGNYKNVITVIPSLVSSENFDAGIFIYGNYVYYASPTTDKNLKGEVENSWIDMKRASLDGKSAPESYFFRLDTNTAKFRYVTVDGVDRNNDGEEDVFCMYEDTNDSTGKSELRSYNTATKETSVLVAGASSIVYNTKDLSDPNVYYTMGVTYHADADNSISESYNQLFTVRADARATVNADKASYTVEGGRTYDFDEAWMKKQNKEAKDDDKDQPYSFGKYETYPYVNLGTLVLDGVGSNTDLIKNHATPDTRYNVNSVAESDNHIGYTYSISRYENGGVYFTRSPLDGGSDPTLYYLSNERDADWNTITANAKNFADVDAVDVVAKDTSKASSSAVYLVAEADGARTHTYLYVSNSTLYRADVVGGETSETTLVRNLSSATLWKTVGDYLYYYTSATNGNNLSRINYQGKKFVDEDGTVNDPYNALLSNSEYQPVEIIGIDWNSSWYKPEFINYDDGTSVFMYSNAQSYGNGGVSYNYIYAAKIGTTEELNANIEKYNAVEDYINEYSSSTDSTNLINYFFRTDLTVEEESKNLYDEKFYAEVEGKFAAEGGELVKESAFIGFVGEMTEDDANAIEAAWKASLLTEEEEVTEEDNSLPGWAIALIVVGSVIVLAAIAVPTALYLKKRKDKKAEEEATVNAYKRKKIDTTDDKSIDVYANEEETPAEEAAEETPAEEAEVETAEEAESNE